MWGSKGGLKAPSNERMEFSIKNFSGGINNVVSPSRIADSESPNMLNVTFTDDGTLQKRPGLKVDESIPQIPYDVNSLDYDLLNAYEIKIKGNKSGYIINQRKYLTYITSKGEVKRLSWDRQYYDKPFSGTRFLDKFFFVDGGTRIHYFKIQELEEIEVPQIYWVKNPPPGFTPTPKPATKGVVKQQKNPDIPNYIDIWYEPCEYELEDGYKGINFCEFNPTLVTTVKDRLYLSGNRFDENMLYISDILEPHYYPASLPIQMPPDGDFITNMTVFNDSLIIARNNDLYALSGNTNRIETGTAYKLTQINSHTGMPNDRCANVVHGFLFFVGSDGNCYKMSPSYNNSNQIVTQQLNLKIDFKIKPFFKTLEQIKQAHTGYDPVRGEWFVEIDKLTFVYNFRLMAWTVYNNVSCSAFVTTDDSFYLCKQNCTFTRFDKSVLSDYYDLYKLNIPIHSFWQSKDIDFGRPTRVKQVRDTYLVSETFDRALSTVNVRLNIDYVDVSKVHQITGEASYWDEAIWDVNKFIGYNINRSYPMMIGRRGRTFSVYISNQGNFAGLWQGLPSNNDIADMEYGTIFATYSSYDSHGNPTNIKFYKRGNYNLELGSYVYPLTEKDMFQPMKIYEFNGLYELRGYR